MNTRTLFLPALFLLLAGTATHAQSGDASPGIRVGAGERAELAGTVVDAATGKPLAFASIRIPAARVSVLTDANGRFRIPRVAAGTYGVVTALMGYTARAEIWSVAAGDGERQVRLQPNPVALAALRVEVRRLERRLRATGWSARAWNRSELAASAEPTAELFVRQVANLTPVPCAALSVGGSRECMRVRGAPSHPCVVLDDTPSSFAELAMYHPSELYRVEIYRGGAAILVYTTTFADQMVRARWTLAPVEITVQQYCQSL